MRRTPSEARAVGIPFPPAPPAAVRPSTPQPARRTQAAWPARGSAAAGSSRLEGSLAEKLARAREALGDAPEVTEVVAALRAREQAVRDEEKAAQQAAKPIGQRLDAARARHARAKERLDRAEAATMAAAVRQEEASADFAAAGRALEALQVEAAAAAQAAAEAPTGLCSEAIAMLEALEATSLVTPSGGAPEALLQQMWRLRVAVQRHLALPQMAPATLDDPMTGDAAAVPLGELRPESPEGIVDRALAAVRGTMGIVQRQRQLREQQAQHLAGGAAQAQMAQQEFEASLSACELEVREAQAAVAAGLLQVEAAVTCAAPGDVSLAGSAAKAPSYGAVRVPKTPRVAPYVEGDSTAAGGEPGAVSDEAHAATLALLLGEKTAVDLEAAPATPTGSGAASAAGGAVAAAIPVAATQLNAYL